MSKVAFESTKVRHEATGMMRWLLTYADMLTLLFAMFVIFVAISLVQQAVIENLRKRQVIIVQRDPRDRLLVDEFNRFIRSEKLTKVVSTQVYPFGILIRLSSSDLIFDVGKASLKPKAKQILSEIARLIKKYSFKNDIEVEGNTDNTPIHGLYSSNWDLSAARALSVVHYWIGVEKINPETLIPVAYGQYHPLVPNATPANRAINRRIDIRILRVSMSALESAEILSKGKKEKGGL